MDRLVVNDGRTLAWAHAKSGLPVQVLSHSIAREVGGEIVSAFVFDSFQDKSCALHTCTDRPYTRTLLRETFRTMFIQWGYTHVHAVIQALNPKSLNLAKHLGFHEIGRSPDLVFFILEKENCKWL